jgi:spore germination protein KC
MLFRFALIGVLMLTIFCTGCYGAAETDSIAYVLVMGIDKAADGKQKVTYQIALPLALGGNPEEKAAPSQTPWITDTIIIPTPAESRMLIDATTSRSPKTNHLVTYVFSEEVARQGISPSIAYIARNRDYRESIYLIVVKGSAEEYIKNNKPKLETNIAHYYQTLLLTHNPGNYYLDASFHQFICRLKESGGSPVATYSAINPMTGEDTPLKAATPEEKTLPYLPGTVPRTGTANPVEFLGLAVFRGDKMVGTLDNMETMALALLTGQFKSGFIDVIDPLYPEKDYISLNIYPEGKPKIVTSLENNIPKISITLKVSCEMLAVTSGTHYESVNYRPLVENQVANMLKGQLLHMINHTKELGSDPAGLGMYFRRNFQNTTELQHIDLTGLYQKADIQIDVTAKIRRTGLLRQTTPTIND